MRTICLATCLALGTPVAADTILAARNLRPQSILTAGDISVESIDIPGALTDPSSVIGMEARVALYAGRPIRPSDIGPPTLVNRNEVVSLIYASGGVVIQAEGRALGRGGIGDRIRVMNLSSRTTVSGFVAADGSVNVSQQESP